MKSIVYALLHCDRRSGRIFFGIAAVLVLSSCGPVPASPEPGAPARPDDASAAEETFASEVASDAAPDAVSDATPDTTGAADAVAARDAPGDAPAADVVIPCGAPAYTCPTGYRCVGLATTQCVRAAAVGEPCRNSLTDPSYCVPGADCEPGPDGHRCVAHGANYGRCRNTGGCTPRCDPGLGCDPGTHCRPGLPLGALCGGAGDFCNEAMSCQDVNGTGRCVAHGADGGYCRPDRSCDDGLRCRGVNSGAAVGCNLEYFHCASRLQAADPCDPGADRCGAGTRCLRSRGEYRCAVAPDGSPGGRCRETDPRCDESAVCDDRGWSCVRRVARGLPCGPGEGATVCAAGDSCTGEHPADGGRCAAAGTSPGADCRTTAPQCDGELRCSEFSRYRRTCRTVARAGDRCDLGGVQTLCPSPTRCVPATGVVAGVPVATCATPGTEVEPNDRSVPARTALARSALYEALLSADDLEDCHALRMAAGSALYVEATAGLVARLFRGSGEELGRWTLRAASWGGPLGGFARLDPAVIGVLRDLTAGDYLLCVREAGAPSSPRAPLRYALALGVLPRAW